MTMPTNAVNTASNITRGFMSAMKSGMRVTEREPYVKADEKRRVRQSSCQRRRQQVFVATLRVGRASAQTSTFCRCTLTDADISVGNFI